MGRCWAGVGAHNRSLVKVDPSSCHSYSGGSWSAREGLTGEVGGPAGMEMRRRGGGASRDVGDGQDTPRERRVSFLTRCVEAVFAFVKLAEFEILFILFFVVAFLAFKDLTSQPRYNQILVKNPGDDDFWPFSAFQRKD